MPPPLEVEAVGSAR